MRAVRAVVDAAFTRAALGQLGTKAPSPPTLPCTQLNYKSYIACKLACHSRTFIHGSGANQLFAAQSLSSRLPNTHRQPRVAAAHINSRFVFVNTYTM